MRSPFVRRVVSLAVLFAATAALRAQAPRALTHDDYDQWKSLRGTTYSLDGAWVAYQIEPQFGDGVLEVRQADGDRVFDEPLASGAHFSTDGRYVVFSIGKSKVEERDKKIAELRKKAKEQKEGKKPGEEKPEGETKPEGEPAASETPRRGPGAFAGRGAFPGGGRRGAGGPGGGAGPGGGDRGELAVLDLQTGKVEKIGKVKGHTLSDDVAVLLYQPEKPEPKKVEDDKADKEPAKSESGKPAESSGEPAKAESQKPAEATASAEGERPVGRRGRRGGGFGGGPVGGMGGRSPAAEASADPVEKKRPEGSDLVVRDLVTGKEQTIPDVVEYGLSRQSKWLWYHTSAKKPAKDAKYGLFVIPLAELGKGEAIQVLDGAVHVGGVTFDRDEKVLAFSSDKEDFAADKPQSDIYLWEGQHQPARRIVHAGTPGLPDDMRIGGNVSFSRDGSVLQLSITPKPEDDPLPILPEDKVTLDIWNWQDGMLQTQQQKGGGGRRASSRTAVFHRDQNRFVVIGDETLNSLRFIGPDGSRAIGNEGKAYDKETSWDGRYEDVYLVNTLDGTRTKLMTKLRGNVTNSPGGRYLVWFADDYHWWSYDVASGARRDLTGNLPVAFHKEDDDHPEPDGAHGLAGWTEGDAAVLLYDEFDLWKVSVTTGEAVCVTDGFGRANHLRLRIQRLPQKEEVDFTRSDLLLSAVQVDTMAEGLYTDSLDKVQKPVRLYMADKKVGDVTRPKNATRFFFTQSTFAECPDLWTANADFSAVHRLSDANPQQKDYRWGKAELVHWIDGDGNPNSGVLVKPDGFNPHKKYPMMVYFYEKMTQGLNSYVAPAPGTSPNASYYVSNGYLWFMPDVRYEIGYPGMSCVKSVVSGVQSLIAQGFVDEKGIGAAGHSWGGYQTAFLVTRTNIFAAVESGAPVANMISAYGGIRYGTGMSRQFQYEKAQSRIGGTPWEYPMRYWENSPIFFADKVRTPVLIMANDNDGAVPWTQGIEYFTALRRLGREAYLFNYNGEDHGLRQRQNMKDWTRRMSEYFAHHLKKEPAPKWMTDGVPFAERDAEKLPFAQSYIDAYVKPAPEKPAAAEASARPESSAPVETKSAPSGDNKPAENKPAEEGAAAGRSGRTTRRGPAAGESAPAAKLEKGKPAPDFTATDEAGNQHKLADYRGRMVLVWFFPKADTPGCTAEGCGLRDQFAEFERRQVAVLGVSVDAAADNSAFRAKYEFPFPLICDTERTMAIAYGAADGKDARTARRIAVLIDGEGKVVQYWGRVDPRTFAATAVAALPL